MESDLGIPFLLQVGDDALSDQVRVANDLQDLVVILLDQGQLEPILGGVDLNGARASSAVKTVYCGSLDAGKVDWLLQSLDNTVITVCIAGYQLRGSEPSTLTRSTNPWKRAYLM